MRFVASGFGVVLVCARRLLVVLGGLELVVGGLCGLAVW